MTFSKKTSGDCFLKVANEVDDPKQSMDPCSGKVRFEEVRRFGEVAYCETVQVKENERANEEAANESANVVPEEDPRDFAKVVSRRESVRNGER